MRISDWSSDVVLFRSVTIGTAGCSDGSFQMRDTLRGGGYTTDMANRTNGSGTVFADSANNWGDNTTGNRATVAVDAHYGVSETWDYYQAVHGRSGKIGRPHVCTPVTDAHIVSRRRPAKNTVAPQFTT